ncbi:aquaporin [Basidiobolus meristosporus CBS 931.73]|uniref:Aquaporin n=1 Tax=Basidiobolus meristosporus CBS 931.73 TaxID=1314790 RepID=A0A1Y1XHY2_9FUNG|nr:aquaporin [Basidiobolus meristosporus CBS 931.73]|eukprot:ORX85365.1 aquaporin [Basidiobolus meristosporus CBS 931.73]
MLRSRYRCYLAEFFSTAILVFLGLSVVTQVHVNMKGAAGSWLSINVGFGFAFSIAIYANAGISGAHLNPALTLALWLLKGFPLRKVPGYIISQLLGAFAGAALVYSIFYPAIDEFDGGVRQVTGALGSAGFFATYPLDFLSNGNAVYTEILSTCVLVMAVFAVEDMKRHNLVEFAPIFLGLTLMVIGISTGYLTGYALNPARDLGPRLFLLVAGWGKESFTAYNYYFWVPIVGPIVGGTLGGIMYSFFIYCGPHNKTDEKAAPSLEYE